MSWSKIALCLLLLVSIFSIVSGQDVISQGAGGPPGWLQNINPADYMLLAADLHDPFVFEGEISADAMSSGAGTTTSAGIKQENSSYLYAHQEVNIKIPDETGTNRLWLQVLVFETSELAMAYCLQEFKDYGFTEDYEGFTPDYNGLKDPRLEGGEGASSRFGHIIWYRNMVARIEELGSEERAAPYVPQLGPRWLDKVSKIKPADKPDLHLEPDKIYLSKNADNNLLPTEIAADSQAVAVEVENRGLVEAKKVQLQLYLQKGEEYEPLGSPVPCRRHRSRFGQGCVHILGPGRSKRRGCGAAGPGFHCRGEGRR